MPGFIVFGYTYKHLDVIVVPLDLYSAVIEFAEVKIIIIKVFAEQGLVKQTSFFLYLDVIVRAGRCKYLMS